MLDNAGTLLFGNTVTDGGDGDSFVAAPLDLVAGWRVVRAVLIAAEDGEQQDRGGGVVGGWQAEFGSIVLQEPQLDVGEQELGVASGHLPSEQGHHHQAPRDHGVDGDRALQPVGGVERKMFGPATGLEDPEQVLDARQRRR